MKPLGFSKKERLLKTFQYKSVYRQGRLKKGKFVWFYFMPNGLGYNRLGISASKKICSNNVRRNKIKRLIKEIFRLNKAVFGRGQDIVIVLKKAPQVIEHSIFEKELLKL